MCTSQRSSHMKPEPCRQAFASTTGGLKSDRCSPTDSRHCRHEIESLSMARPELVQTVAKVLANVGASGIVLGTGVSLAYSALFTGAHPYIPSRDISAERSTLKVASNFRLCLFIVIGLCSHGAVS